MVYYSNFLGTYITKADSLNKHERIDDHKFAVGACGSKNSAEEWKKAVEAANIKSKTAVTYAMQIIYYQAKENIATRKFSSMRELCEDLGVDALKDLNVTSSISYDDYKSIHDMETSIAMVLKGDLLEKIASARWYSVMIDESTDVSVTQSVIVYIRIVYKGLLTTHFLELKALNQCDSEHIFEAVCLVLETYNVEFEKISAIGTDGASVMLGHRKGVATRFKEKNPGILAIHCFAHRLALACGQAADNVLYLVKFQDILNKVYKYFEYSAKRSNQLKEAQTILDKAEKKFVQTFSTRWLSFHSSVEAMLCNWSTLMTVLLQDKSAIGQGLLKSISTYKFLASVAFLVDVTYLLQKLCLCFQKGKLDFEIVNDHVKDCMKEIDELKSNTGINNMQFLEKVPKVPEDFIYEDHCVRYTQKMQVEIEAVKTKFLQILLQNLQDRLGELGKIEMFTILLPKNVPAIDMPEFTEYGNKEIKNICEYFEPSQSELKQSIKMLSEWKLFKKILAVRCKGKTFADIVQYLFDSGLDELYPLMVSLYEFVLSLPLTTVDCERGFSLMNIIKTSLRNRMTVDHLSILMSININGPERKLFDFDAAFREWANCKDRKI